MKKRHQGLSARLRTLAEGLDDINVSDPAAWAAMASELETAKAGAPGHPPELAELLQAAAHAVQTLATGGVPDLLGAMDALAQALMQAHLALDGAADSDMLASAAAAVTTALGIEARPAGAEPAAPTNVDEAAAMLIGLEARDRAGWDRLGAGLAELGVPVLTEAASVCRSLADGTAEDPEASVRHIGELIEAAMTPARTASDS
ncbi:MAG: hypothetical protein MUE48_13460, partial [Desulfobacterales bacterium]|nr:hypothetical protein [Desulfobacterales bacterium]